MSEPFDTSFADAPTCPYCGYRERDAWEINFGCGMEGTAEVDCEMCERPYSVERTCTVFYTSTPLEADALLADEPKEPTT
jgi:hypothetical protein